MVLAVSYVNVSFCACLHFRSSTPFGGDEALNVHRSMQCIYDPVNQRQDPYLSHWIQTSGLPDVIHCI